MWTLTSVSLNENESLKVVLNFFSTFRAVSWPLLVQYAQENPFIQSLTVYLQSTTPQVPRNPPALNNTKPKWTRSHVSHRLALSRKLVKRLQRFLANNVPRISTAQEGEGAGNDSASILQSRRANSSLTSFSTKIPKLYTTWFISVFVNHTESRSWNTPEGAEKTLL